MTPFPDLFPIFIKHSSDRLRLTTRWLSDLIAGEMGRLEVLVAVAPRFTCRSPDQRGVPGSRKEDGSTIGLLFPDFPFGLL